MKKKYLSKFNVKDKVLKSELLRAHGMIILLAIAFMFVLTLVTTLDVAPDATLSFIVVILLALVAIISLTVVASLLSKKK